MVTDLLQLVSDPQRCQNFAKIARNGLAKRYNADNQPIDLMFEPVGLGFALKHLCGEMRKGLLDCIKHVIELLQGETSHLVNEAP